MRLESPTTDKAAVDRCGRELASRLEAIGGRVTRLSRADRGDHLLAEFGCGTLARFFCSGHFDTVWPVGQLERMPLVERDGRLHGPGIFDMKAGIAIGMLAVRALLETGAPLTRRIVMLWTTDEEVGSASSRQAIEDEARRSDAVLVLEPSLPGGALKTSRKGCGGYEVLVRGVASHAGVDPAKGASAIHELAHQVVRIQALQDLARGVSVNVTTIQGGSRTNVIPDEARAFVDVRVPTMADAEAVDRALRALEPVDSADAAGGVGRRRSSTDGTKRGRRASVRSGAGDCPRARAGSGRGWNRRRLGREFYGCAGGSHIRRPRRDRRRRARAARTRRAISAPRSCSADRGVCSERSLSGQSRVTMPSGARPRRHRRRGLGPRALELEKLASATVRE